MDSFLLARLARELANCWTGARIQGVWQDLGGRLVLKLYRRGRVGFLVLSPVPESSGIGLVEKRPACTQRPTALAAYLRAHARGGRFEAVRALRFECVLEIVVRERDKRLSIHLEGVGRRSNLIVCDSEGVVRIAWRWEELERSPLRPVEPGMEYRPPPKPAGLAFPDEVSPRELRAWLISETPLNRRILGLGPGLAREIRARAAASDAWGAFCSVVGQYDTPAPVLEYPHGLSAVALTHLGSPVATHPSALERAGAWLDERMTKAQEEATRRATERQERRFRVRLERRLAKIQAELNRFPDPADQRARADALGAHLANVGKGARTVELPDPRRPGEKIELTLDPSRTPGENLNHLYRNAQRAERALAVLARRLRETRRELEIGPEIRPATIVSKKHKGEGLYRRYLSSDGLPIWVGRNGRENDRLLRDARPWDLWLHARDAPGAHVLVRKPGREAKVPDRSVLEAAGLAALYSRATDSGAVEVMVAEVTRVRKPKGAPPGRVVVAGERTVRVPPGAGNPRPSPRSRG